MANTPVNALVRVATNNDLDFIEWLEYHIALGFDRIYAYDTGNHGWLPEVCRKHSDHVTLIPMANNDWRKKSNIIKAYVEQTLDPSWAVCLEDDEYIWMDLSITRSISNFINKHVAPRSLAMSVYVKYMSSEKPMKSRVGTLIDCFQHVRPNPQGFVHPCQLTPNCSFTFFYVPNNKCMPMSGPLTPNVKMWIDSRGSALDNAHLGAYLASQSYNPDIYPIRGYKYALKSGIEMGMAPGTKPVGYTVRDNHMLEARAALLRIPVNESTETIYAKSEVLVEKPALPKRELSPEETAELELPVPLGKIDTFILYGYPLEHVIEFAAKNGYEDTEEHREVIKRVYRRECSMIIESTPVYKRLYEMDKLGHYTDDMVCAELKISYPALVKMRKCMSVLDIEEHEQKKEETAKVEAAADAEQAKAVVDADNIADLTSQFDATVNANPVSKEDEKRFEIKVEERRAKRREQNKRSKERKKANEEAKKKSLEVTTPTEPIDTKVEMKPKAEKLKVIEEPKDEEPAQTAATAAEEEVVLDLGADDLLSNTDLSAFGNVDA